MANSNSVRFSRPKRFRIVRSVRYVFAQAYGPIFYVGTVCAILLLISFPQASKRLFDDRQTETAQLPQALNGGNAWGGKRDQGGQSSAAPGNHIAGPVTHVRDGDTIEVSGVPVRIANLDCAETGSQAGARATRYMRQLVSSDRLDCRLSGRMSYDRHVGTCRLSTGRDIGEELIAEGVCRRWR